MSALNPYGKFLDGQPLEAILSATAGAINQLLTAMSAEKVNTPPAPGKWSPAQIVAHLADCELVFAFRLRQTLAEDAPTIQPFDQDKWAATYTGVSPGQAMGVFSSLRGWNLRLIGLALPQAAERPVTHPERGTMTFQTLVETMAGHDLNHLAQLEKIASGD
ncbi:MAG: DinB family protein [Terracidiphilus sp.]|nr:DinB family protein [Terracidiphilus sp.]